METGGAKLLLVGLLAARRALAERPLGHLLQVVLLVTAGRAAVFIDRHDAIISLISERNIVFHVVELARLLRRRRARRWRPRTAFGCAARLAALGQRTRLAAAFAPAEHLHDVGADLGRVA